MFESEAHSFLLFLNNIEKIELYEKDSQHQEPRRLLTVKIADQCLQQVRAARQEFADSIRQPAKEGQWRDAPTHTSYCINIEMMRYEGKRNEVITKKYLVTQYYEGGDCADTLEELLAGNLATQLPWVGVALPLDEDQAHKPRGQLFCFLPLPVTEGSATGFHFHVNGYFAVDQNRFV